MKKRGEDKVAAGVFTQPHALGYVVDALEKGVERGVISKEEVTQEGLEGFFGKWGRAFYQIEDKRGERVVLGRGGEKILDVLKKKEGGVEVVPFRRGEQTWSVEWK